mmetsp:Transcript_131378/g.227463  ORF Transcript_131378/g.227463 Transcript_131378/m.227463 type:complete len:305 (-) Transcript_131378:1075-1989(-)
MPVQYLCVLCIFLVYELTAAVGLNSNEAGLESHKLKRAADVRLHTLRLQCPSHPKVQLRTFQHPPSGGLVIGDQIGPCIDGRLPQSQRQRNAFVVAPRMQHPAGIHLGIHDPESVPVLTDLCLLQSLGRCCQHLHPCLMGGDGLHELGIAVPLQVVIGLCLKALHVESAIDFGLHHLVPLGPLTALKTSPCSLHLRCCCMQELHVPDCHLCQLLPDPIAPEHALDPQGGADLSTAVCDNRPVLVPGLGAPDALHELLVLPQGEALLYRRRLDCAEELGVRGTGAPGRGGRRRLRLGAGDACPRG